MSRRYEQQSEEEKRKNTASVQESTARAKRLSHTARGRKRRIGPEATELGARRRKKRRMEGEKTVGGCREMQKPESWRLHKNKRGSVLASCCDTSRSLRAAQLQELAQARRYMAESGGRLIRGAADVLYSHFAAPPRPHSPGRETELFPHGGGAANASPPSRPFPPFPHPSTPPAENMNNSRLCSHSCVQFCVCACAYLCVCVRACGRARLAAF